MQYRVKTEYITQADGTLVKDGEEIPVTYHGPFESEASCLAFIDCWDGDTDVEDQYIQPILTDEDRLYLNSPASTGLDEAEWKGL